MLANCAMQSLLLHTISAVLVQLVSLSCCWPGMALRRHIIPPPPPPVTQLATVCYTRASPHLYYSGVTEAEVQWDYEGAMPFNGGFHVKAAEILHWSTLHWAKIR